MNAPAAPTVVLSCCAMVKSVPFTRPHTAMIGKTASMLPLTPRQTSILRAAIDRIIPPDDFPGGWDAGVGDYLARQFDHDIAPLIATYRAGIDGLDATARANEGLAHREEFFPESTREGVQLAAVQAALQALRDRIG